MEGEWRGREEWRGWRGREECRGAKRTGGVEGEWRGREEWRGSGEEGRSGGGVDRKGGVEGEWRGREEWRGSGERVKVMRGEVKFKEGEINGRRGEGRDGGQRERGKE